MDAVVSRTVCTDHDTNAAVASDRLRTQEDIMLKTVLAGTTALAIAGASLAYAAQPGRSISLSSRR